MFSFSLILSVFICLGLSFFFFLSLQKSVFKIISCSLQLDNHTMEQQVNRHQNSRINKYMRAWAKSMIQPSVADKYKPLLSDLEK